MKKPKVLGDTSQGQVSLQDAGKAWSLLRRELIAAGWTPAWTAFPSSLPARVSYKLGIGSSLRTLAPNPQFYELIMGWPIGWTAPGGQVTAYAAWLRHARGQFLNLLTTWTPDGEPTE